MIAVIADDFTGAAEIGGVGIRHGFDVIIETQVVTNIDTDILIIATDTRSLDVETSQALVEKITADLLALQPAFIYKKFDSILRGNVGEELLAQLQASHKERALLVPANPALKRTIRDGIYYYDGIPLKEFNFSNAQLDERASSKVLDLIGERARSYVTVISTDNRLPEKGLIIGNTVNEDDLKSWAQKIDADTIPAGGASFFDAILQAHGGSQVQKQTPLLFGKKVIYVCGSAFLPSRLVVQKAKQAGQWVVNMPKGIFCNRKQGRNLLAQWADEIVQGIEKRSKVILAVDEIDGDGIENLALSIREVVAEVIGKVMKEIKIDELVIEGGATAYSIIKKLNYTRFYPTQELAPGVTRMKVEENKDISLTLKPGSYKWPSSIWQY